MKAPTPQSSEDNAAEQSVENPDINQPGSPTRPGGCGGNVAGSGCPTPSREALVFGLARHFLILVAAVALFPYGFFLVQAIGRTMSWPKAIQNTGVLLLIHIFAGALVLLPSAGHPSMIRTVGFIVLAMNVWFGYDWQVGSMTSSNGYADWQRALRWLGVFLKVLAVGAIFIDH